MLRRLLVIMAAMLAGCTTTATPPPPTPTRDAVRDGVRIVNLNAAMGYRNGAGDPAGTDATTEDFELLADDILDQGGDIANLQEMALPAAQELRTILGEKTGDEWELNFSYSSTASYFTGRKGETGPRPGYRDVPAGNAQLIRVGDLVTSQRPLTDDGKKDDGGTADQGIMLPSAGRSFVGAEITVAGWDSAVAVYNTHLALARQVSDEVRAGDVREIQSITTAGDVPVVLTGDFNQNIDFVPGDPHPSPRTVDAIRALMDTYGFADVARDKGPTIDENRPELEPRRIDYIFVRGIRATDTVRFVSRESDHWGLATTIAAEGIPSSYAPPPTLTPEPGTTMAPTTSDPTPAAAIARYERFLRAINQRNLPVQCEIAGPAARRAQEAGYGPCEENMSVLASALSPAQMAALPTATVDPVKVTATGTTVRIPATAIRADAAFTATDIGDAVLSYLDGQWFITD